MGLEMLPRPELESARTPWFLMGLPLAVVNVLFNPFTRNRREKSPTK